MKKISGAIQIILLAPVKLPAKVLNVFKYIGLGLGIIESVIAEDDEADATGKKNVQLPSSDTLMDRNEDNAFKAVKPKDRNDRYDLDTGKEVLDET